MFIIGKGKTNMKKFEDWVEELNKDVEIPANVEARFEETLADIGNYKAKKKFGAVWMKVAAIAGAVVIGGAALCYTNPVIAAKVPIIGKIFEQVEDNVSYSGKYSKDKEVKTVQKKENQSAAVDEAEEIKLKGKDYTATSNGTKISASEIYSDGYSVYLTVNIKSEKGGFNKAASYYTTRFGEKTAQSLYTKGTYKIGNSRKTELCNNPIEGKAVDDNTFVGMIKLDRNQYSDKNGAFTINLSAIGYDDINKLAEDDPKQMTDGKWKLVIPYTVDKKASKIVEVNKKDSASNYGIDKVLVSPYQVVVFADTPKGVEDPNWEAAVFSNDGKALEFQDQPELDRMVYAVQGADVSKVHVYLGRTTFDLLKATKEKRAQELSIVDAEIDIK